MSERRTAMVCGRLCTAPIGDYYVTCSFDSNHVLLRSRMPYHIVNCAKNHPGHNKLQCPYDATEYIDPEQYTNHILSCKSKRSTFAERYETAELKAKGSMCNIKQTPFFHECAPEPDEEWGGRADPGEEDLPFEWIAGVGRGLSSKKPSSDPVPKKGMGRAAILNRIFNDYQKRQANNSCESLNSSGKENSLKINVPGQFDDNSR